MAVATERQAASGPIVSLAERFNIADYLVDRHVREGHGSRTAILCGDESITYAQVAERSNRLANGLRVRTASSTYHIEDRPIVPRGPR